MKFSIIIPVYNAEKSLCRCLDSIINQDCGDYEIIIVNDGSTDNSESICLKYSNKRQNINYIFKENGGASSARNVGLDAAKGDFVLFIDSDDYVDENYFSALSNNCVKNGLSVFTYTWQRADGFVKRNITTDNDLSLFEKSKSLILNRSINSPCAKIFDRNLIENVHLRFDERMPVAEDFNFCLKYLMFSDKVNVLNESIYFYDITNESSLVHKRKKGLIDIYPIVFDYAYETINNSRFNDGEKKELLRVWDKLHTDSFITCVMEEIKDVNMTPAEVKKEIRSMCKKFCAAYNHIYGYENLVHFAVRFCVKNRCVNVLYYFSKIYARLRK